MTVFQSDAFDGYEQVVFCRDPEAGLSAILAIHDTTLGPAVGGCRMWPFASEAEALRDVLRLSRGMTYKSALAGLPFGGGKSVILGDPRRDKTEALLSAFGRCVDRLGGRYVVAEDVGIGVEDVEIIARQTRHVAGRDRGPDAGGDPSPLTAHGVFVGMRAAVKHRLGAATLRGLRVAVQGLGHVGERLCACLRRDGAQLVVADIDERAVRTAVERHGARAVDPAALCAQDVDVFAPCALGGVLNDATLPRLRAGIVAGAANNQLAEDRHGDELAARGVLYAPDYVINAGGIISVALEIEGARDPGHALEQVTRIHGRLLGIFGEAEARGVAPHRVADAMARARIAAARGDRELPGRTRAA
jgi:leucine dehydrogenase